MNPAAILVCSLGVLFIVIGFRGKSDNVIAAVTGKPYGKSSLQ